MIDDFSDVILDFSDRVRVNVQRALAGVTHDAAGRAVQPTTTKVPVMAVVETVSGDQLLRLPESFHDKEVARFYTVDPLYGVSLNTKQPPDLVEWPGHGLFQVQEVQDWSAKGNYYKSLGIKILAQSTDPSLNPPTPFDGLLPEPVTGE